MMFKELPAVSANSNKTKWEMSDITFFATVKNNDDFSNFSGKWANSVPTINYCLFLLQSKY